MNTVEKANKINYTKEIYKLQHELNCLVGRDTINDPKKEEWIDDYCTGLMSEAIELLDCCNWKWWTVEGRENHYGKIIDLKNAKIEAIDCLHFAMSLYNISHVPEFQNIFILESDFLSIPSQLSDEKFGLICKNLYKWIAMYEITQNEDDLLGIFEYLKAIFKKLDMSIEEIFNIYKMKHEKNILRQKNKYSMLTKTEDDNNEIKEKI